MQEGNEYVTLFDQSIKDLFREAYRISRRNPARALFMLRTLRRQQRAARVRMRWAQQGIQVPPFMIASITHRCNLRCKGCYAMAQQHAGAQEMSAEKLRRVVAEADELGVSIILLAGGEPLTRPEMLDITADYPQIVFPLFTNGTLLDEAMMQRIKSQRHVVPIISLEGHQIDTDSRRGAGVHSQALKVMHALHAQHILFGTSLTLTRQNFDVAMDAAYLRQLIAAGCQVFFFVDYVPVQEGTEALLLTDEQREGATRMLAAYQEEMPALFIALPGDEEMYGGCLAAGRGFIHINPEGRVEPCPFSPFSDSSLQEMSLKEALQSDFLKAIRANADELDETRGGCALWTKRDWVQSLLPAADAVPTDVDAPASGVQDTVAIR
jgi:MoaA/NifB/PqqE/SkfB family radical SAM enzyme